jgi:hypothetical protein
VTAPNQDQRSESELLIDILLGLRVDRVRAFMDRVELPRSGTKSELRERADVGLLDGTFSINDLVDYLDEVEPWGRQHVILLEAEGAASSGWRRTDGIRRRLREAGVEHLLDRRRRQRLPETLSLSAINLRDDTLEIVAVERREYDERAPELDRPDHQEDGQLIFFKAYRHVVTRGLLTLRWNIATRAAALHVSEGFGRYDYDDALARFSTLIAGFIDLDRFDNKEIGRAIHSLHEAERAGAGEIRSHRVGYQSRGGRTVEAASPSTNVSVVGERVVDDAMTGVGGAATGRIGNFFWLPSTGPIPASNPIATRDLHIVIIAQASRVHFMVPSDEESISYVLQRIRALS